VRKYTDRGPARLRASWRLAIIAGLAIMALGAFTSSIAHPTAALAAACSAGTGSTIPANLNGTGGVTIPNVLNGGSVKVDIDNGVVTFSSDGSGNVTVVQNAGFSGVNVSSGSVLCNGGTVDAGSSNFTSSVGSCTAPTNITLQVNPATGSIPAGGDTLSFNVQCGPDNETISMRVSGNGLPTPEAPSSVLFGAGAVLVLLALRRSRRSTITPA
jgi:hypothetical protein